jgi:hypothetical protein
MEGTRKIKEGTERTKQRRINEVDPQLVNQNCLLNNNKKLIERIEFHKKIKEFLLNLSITNQIIVLVFSIVIIIII